MRVFIAIDIDEQVRSVLSNLQQQLANSVDIKKSDVKWVEPENIHLTLKFLGEIKDEESVQVCNIVKKIASRHKGFQLDVESVGCFGGKKPRVLWIGTGKGSDNLLQLQEDLESQLASAGWPKENREFTGHLTICRIRNPAAAGKLAQVIEKYKHFKAGVISADSLAVYQSKLKPTGPVYIRLCEYQLQ